MGGRSSRVSGVLMSGPLAPFADAFAAELLARGYTSLATAGELRQVARLSCWLDAGGLSVGDLSGERVEEFLAWQRAGGRHRSQWSRPVLVCVLEALRGLGVLGPEPTTCSSTSRRRRTVFSRTASRSGSLPTASTLIYGSQDAVLTDPGMTTEQAQVLGDWVARKGRNLTDIFITHGHGDHWFAAGLLAERFGARIVASAGTIAQMHENAATRPLLWDKVYTGIPPSPVTAVSVPDNRFSLEGHDLVIVEVGATDSDDTSVLHVPDLGLVVAGDVIYNGVHMYLAQTVLVGGFEPWRAAIDKVEALKPRHIVAGHQNQELDDDAERTIAETRQYLDDAEELLRTENSAVGFFNAKLERYPNHLGRTVLWVGTSVVYGVREHPEQDVRQIIVNAWL